MQRNKNTIFFYSFGIKTLDRRVMRLHCTTHGIMTNQLIISIEELLNYEI